MLRYLLVKTAFTTNPENCIVFNRFEKEWLNEVFEFLFFPVMVLIFCLFGNGFAAVSMQKSTQKSAEIPAESNEKTPKNVASILSNGLQRLLSQQQQVASTDKIKVSINQKRNERREKVPPYKNPYPCRHLSAVAIIIIAIGWLLFKQIAGR